MYPNPSDGYITFNKSIDLIEIFDITGKKPFFFLPRLSAISCWHQYKNFSKRGS